MSDIFGGEDDGNTPLTPDEKMGLIPSYISTRGELNREEQRNITQGEIWAYSRTRDILDIDTLKRLHKEMLKEVWEWAGEFSRQYDRPIGVDTNLIEIRLRELLDNVKYWVAHDSFPRDEIAARFHQGLTWIHPFPNGNGRHSRIATDMLLRQLGGEPFSWGRGNLREASELRRAYVSALRKADNHDFIDLVAFARGGQ